MPRLVLTNTHVWCQLLTDWQEKKQDVRIHVLIIIVALHFIGYYGIENVWRDQIFHGVSSL